MKKFTVIMILIMALIVIVSGVYMSIQDAGCKGSGFGCMVFGLILIFGACWFQDE